MAITYPLAVADFWERLRFAGRPVFELDPMRSQSQDDGGNVFAAFRPQPKWRASVALGGGWHDANLSAGADLAHLDLRDGTFLAYDTRRPYPAFDPRGEFLGKGSMIDVGGVASSGNTGTGVYTVEGQAATLAQAVAVDSDAGTWFDIHGVLQTAAADALRLDYGPFANQIRNSKCAGASAPSTFPTNFSQFAASGLAWSIVGPGNEDGVDGFYVRLSGTAVGSSNSAIYFESTTGIVCANTQVWSQAVFCRVSAGSQTNVSAIQQFVNYMNSGGSFSSAPGNQTISVGSTLARYSRALTISDASAAFFRPGVGINTVAGPVDITLFVAYPTAERAASATTYPRLPLGVLAETGFTNRLVRSREFDNGSWTKTRTSVTANVAGVLDPWGTSLADKIVEDSTAASTHIVYQSYTTTNYVNHVGYVLAKAAERTIIKLAISNFTSDECSAFFNLVTGAVTSVSSGAGDFTGASARIVPLWNGWYWCEIEALKTSGDTDCILVTSLCDASGNNVYSGNGSSGIYLAHKQLEEGTAGHMPVVTTTAAVTRAADALSFHAAGRNDWTLTFDNDATQAFSDVTGDHAPAASALSRPHVKAWSAIRDTQPAPASVQVKSKGSNNRSLALKGLPRLFRITKGDKLSIAYGSGKYFLFEVMETAVADGLGDTAEFEIQPTLPPGTAVNDAVTLIKAPGKFKKLAGPTGERVASNISDGAGFAMVSVP